MFYNWQICSGIGHLKKKANVITVWILKMSSVYLGLIMTIIQKVHIRLLYIGYYNLSSKTIDFILDFTNKTTICFAHSRFAKNEIEEVDVFIEEGKFIKQYICNRLWCSYRGTQVSTYLLSSIHMALEKIFLEHFKSADSKVLESWLLFC